MSETQLNHPTRAQEGAFSVLLRACSAITSPQCTDRVVHFVMTLAALMVATACSGSNKGTPGSGGSPFGGESSQSSGGSVSVVGTSSTGGTNAAGLSSSGGLVSVGGSGSVDTSTGGSTGSCTPEGGICQFVWCCDGMTCNAGFCRKTAGTGGSQGTGGAKSTGGNAATGGATSVCGNGVIERGETCDPPSSCPITCPGENACNVAARTGSASTCDLFCGSVSVVTVCKSGDSCCALGCSYSNDTDCPNTGGASCSRDSAIDVTNTSGGCNFVASGTYLWGWSCSGVDPSTQGLSCIYAESAGSSTLYCCTSQ